VEVTGYREQEDFDASENGVSFGRYQKSTGTFNFVSMSSTTYDAANAYPKVGPIVINEVHYNPASGGQNEEFIELRNITGSAVNLYDGSLVPWKFTDGINYEFPVGIQIPANGYLLVVKTTPAYFATLYSVPGGVQVLGPYDGNLDNGGEKLEISKPGDIDTWGSQTYIRVDRVSYSDGYESGDPWPSGPDGNGGSLNRTTAANYGNDPANWHSATPSPGANNN
jgi:hypothetical protein